MRSPGTLWPATLAGVSATQLVETETIAFLREDPTLAGMVGDRIYVHVPPSAPFPLVKVEAPASNRWGRGMRGIGRQITLQIKAQSQVLGDYEVNAIASEIVRILETAKVSPLGPLRRAEWEIDEGQPSVFTEDVAGVMTYYSPVIIRVYLTV